MQWLAVAGSKVAGFGLATYGGRPMRLSLLCAIAFFVGALPLRLCAEDSATVRAADGFELPIGPNGTGEGYYIARGYRPNGHLGEDWNGVHGGNTDLGDPVCAIANGYVMFARNYHVGWGNVVILRHAYYEGLTLKYCDSLYGHLLDFSVQEGEQVRRGQKIGRLGNNFGMYEAHLHLEMRKNLQIGMFRNSFARDFSNYYTPNEFIAAHRACPNGNHMVSIPINTYAPVAPPALAGPHVQTPVFGPPPAGAPPRFSKVSPLPPVVPLAPVPTPTPTPAAKVITKVTTPAPATPEPKIAKSPVVIIPTATPTPSPVAKSSKTASTTVAAASPTPKHSKSSATATASANTPEGKPSKTSKASTADTASATELSTPTPTTKHSKSTAATATPARKASKESAPDTASGTEPSTPASASKHSKSTASAATPTPTPAGKSSKKASTSVAVASPTPAPSKKAAKAPAPIAQDSPKPQPAVVTKAETESIVSTPILPAPTTTNLVPIRRAGSGYKVDRFEDLRGKAGY